MAFAERAQASVVGRDRRAFLHLGPRYEQFDRTAANLESFGTPEGVIAGSC